MLQKSIFVAFILIAFSTASVAQETKHGNFQINSVVLVSSYPVFNNAGGQDTFRFTAAGIGIKSSRGQLQGFRGLADFTVYFPFVYEQLIHPNQTFIDRSREEKPFLIDIMLGAGYAIDLDILTFIFGGGIHTSFFSEKTDYLFTLGISLDAQSAVRLGKIITAQFGTKFNIDFFGTQSFFSKSRNFSGIPIGFAVYAGFGFNF